jgi:nicotinate-nucleotide pyrophosphorylase (carboxylating)
MKEFQVGCNRVTMDLEKEIEKLIDKAIEEDMRKGDLTTEACIPSDTLATARFVLKQAGVVAGLPFLKVLFNKLDPKIEVTPLVIEGSYQKAGTLICTITGPVRGILSGERVALNFIQHASGVATITAAYVKRVSGFDCAILDTRKTLPGLRALEKYAVRMGGGVNHRFGLDDRFIIKINHLSFVKNHSKKPIVQAVQNIRAKNQDLPIEIEIEDLNDLDEALSTEAVALMLVNMSPDEVKKSANKIKRANKKAYVESGGTITLDTIRAYAETGVNGISVGALTHSVQALEITMRLL